MRQLTAAFGQFCPAVRLSVWVELSVLRYCSRTTWYAAWLLGLSDVSGYTASVCNNAAPAHRPYLRELMSSQSLLVTRGGSISLSESRGGHAPSQRSRSPLPRGGSSTSTFGTSVEADLWLGGSVAPWLPLEPPLPLPAPNDIFVECNWTPGMKIYMLVLILKCIFEHMTDNFFSWWRAGLGIPLPLQDRKVVVLEPPLFCIVESLHVEN